jgi:hypothetical protein
MPLTVRDGSPEDLAKLPALLVSFGKRTTKSTQPSEKTPKPGPIQEPSYVTPEGQEEWEIHLRPKPSPSPPEEAE